MKKLLTMSIAISLIMQFITGCSGDNENAKSMEQLYAENGIPVKIKIVEKKLYAAEYRYTTVLSGIKESAASAMIADKVDKIHFNVGADVNKDDVIMSFPTDNPAAQYYQAKVAYEHSAATFKRMENLYNSGGISLQEFENTRTQYEVSKANWRAVQQSIKVRAPISGKLTSINVQESDNVHPGDALFTISQTNRLKAKLWINESERRSIQPGDRAEARLNGDMLHGTITQADISLNSKNQAFGATVEFDNPGRIVMSGTNAEVIIYSGAGKESIIVDRKNVMQKGERNCVFVAEHLNAVLKDIEIGNDYGLDLEIISGLTPGDSLITEGQLMLKDGDHINIINE